MVWLLPEPVRTAQTDTTGLVDLTWVAMRAHQAEICPGSQHHRSLVHDDFVRHIAISKNDLVSLFFFDQL